MDVNYINDDDTMATFREQGFFVWRQLLPPDVIDEHLEEFEKLHAQHGVSLSDDFAKWPQAVQTTIRAARAGFHQQTPATQKLLFVPPLVRFLRLLLGAEPVMHQPETGFHERKTPLHTDSLDLKVCPSGADVRIWCALEDIHPDAGPVFVVPRSHIEITQGLEDEIARYRPELDRYLRTHQGATTAADYFKATGEVWSYVKHELLERLITERELSRLTPTLKKGDVLIFTPDLVHGTSPCINAALTRKYLIAFYASTKAVWFHSRAFWPGRFDYRTPANAISAPIIKTEHGLKAEFSAIHSSYLRSFERPVDTRPVAVSDLGR